MFLAPVFRFFFLSVTGHFEPKPTYRLAFRWILCTNSCSVDFMNLARLKAGIIVEKIKVRVVCYL